MMLCGCMFMFVTNSRTHETAQNLGSTYVDAVDSVVGIANSTKNVLKTEVGENFVPCLLDVIKSELSHHGIDSNFGNPLKTFVERNVTTALNTADTMAGTIDALMTSLKDIKSKSDDLKTDGTNLDNQFTTFRNDLDTAKASCTAGAQCDVIDGIK